MINMSPSSTVNLNNPTSNKVMKKNIYVILGPTSSGKTSLSIKLCKDFNGEIVSFDSRQLFKHMDLATGKLPITSGNQAPSPVEKHEGYWILDGITIWGYDLVSPNDFYSGYDFALFALNKIRELMSRGKQVFLVGGTGFYLDLITKNVEPSNIEPNFELRKELEKLSLEELQFKLTSLNKNEFNKIDNKNPARLIRSIEKVLGVTKNLNPLPYFTSADNVEFVYIGLTSENKYLFDRVDIWVESMWEKGLVMEVKKLIDLGFENSTKLKGLVYKSVLEFLKPTNTLTEAQIKQLIKYDLHAYIRRQLTYFKRNKNIKWFDISTGDYIKNIYNLING